MVILLQNLFIGLKVRLDFYRNLKEDYITQEKNKKKQEKNKKNLFKSKVNEIVIGSNKLEDQKSVTKNIETLYESREKSIELFNNNSKIVSEVNKVKAKQGKID